jgi:hypothetical protein
MDKSNTREASRVTLADCKGRSKEIEEHLYRSRSNMNLRHEERVFGVGKWLPRLCTYKKMLDKSKQDNI